MSGREQWERLLPGQRLKVCSEITQRIRNLRASVTNYNPTPEGDARAWEAVLAVLEATP